MAVQGRKSEVKTACSGKQWLEEYQDSTCFSLDFLKRSRIVEDTVNAAFVRRVISFLYMTVNAPKIQHQ